MLHKYFFYILFTLIMLSPGFTLLNAESEPNDTPEQANPLLLNGSDAGTLGETDLVDWWKVTVPSDGKLVVATLSDATLEIDNYIYDQDKTTQIASYAYNGSHTWDTTYFVNLLAGTYYIKTSRWSGGGAYSIANNFTPANYQNDPEINDSVQVATNLSMNGSTTGHLGFYSLGYTDINDWWKVTVPLDGKLVVATLSDPTIEIDNYLYDKDKTTQIASFAYGGSHTWDTTYFVNLVPGTYYIRTNRWSGYGGYTITNSFIPTKFENDSELNDTVEASIPFTLNGSSTGHLGFYSLGYTDPRDWRKIAVPSDGKLIVATLSDHTLEIDNYIYDQDGKTLIASYAYGGSHDWDTVYFNNLTPGNYFVRTTCWSGYGSYSIANQFIPARYSNDPEPNDSMSVAKSMPFNNTLTGHSGYYNKGFTDDNDYFYFNVASGLDTLFIRSDSEPILEIDLRLYNSSGELVNYAGVYGTTELIVHPNLQTGTYYIRVLRWSGFGSYGLLITNVRPNTPLVSVENNTRDLVPKEFDLKQNYPNPFNPTTNIEFQIANSGFVSLKVYDILGNEVSTLLNEEKQTGFYKVEFNAAKYNLSSGIYFYQLREGNFVKIKKLILMK